MRKPQKMTKTRFDNIIRENVEKDMALRGEKSPFGYVVKKENDQDGQEKPYENYYTEEAFELFKKEMKNEYEKIHEQFRNQKNNFK